jgi:hypothetical protein
MDKRRFNRTPQNLGKYSVIQPVIDRLMRHSVGTDSVDGCWEWTGQRDDHGYGRIKLTVNGTKKGAFVHRAAYAQFNPEWDGKSKVLHRCDNPPCWNRAHLFAGTHADNMRDMKNKGRGNNQGVNGERNPNAILTWEKVRCMRADFASGLRREVICDKFSIPRYLLGQVLRKESWKE